MKNMKKNLFFTLLTIIVMLLIACGGGSDGDTAPASGGDSGAAANPDQLRFVSGPTGGNWFQLGGALSEAYSSDVLQTTSSVGGGVSNIFAVGGGKADLGFSVASLVGAALTGEGFEQKAENVALLSNAYAQVTYFIINKNYAENNSIKTLGDVINNKIPLNFATLKKGTSSEFVVNSLFKKGYNSSIEDIEQWGGSVQYASYTGGADLLRDGHIDMFAFSVGEQASIVMNIETQVDIMILPADQTALDALADAYGTYTYTIQPGGVYTSVGAPVITVGDYTSIIIRADMPEQLAYDLAQATWENKSDLAAAVSDFGALTPERAVQTALTVHPGAKRYWQEANAQ